MVWCSCFRRSTTLLVVLGEWLLLSKKPTPQGFVRRLLPCPELMLQSHGRYCSWRCL